MAIAGCSCNGYLGNTGYPNVKPFGVTSGIYMVPLLADDGTRNGIDLTAADLGVELLALVNNVDPSKRAYPFLNLKNVTHTEAEANYETADNGERFKTRDGIKTVSYEVWDVTEQYFNKTAGACVEFGLFLVDNCGNLKGEKSGDTLYPRPVNRASFNSMYIDAVADAGAKVRFEMDYNLVTSDGDQWMIPAAEFGAIKALELKGLIDVRFTLVDVVSATEFVVDAAFDYGSAVNPLAWKGAVNANFNLYNVTDAAGITITTVAESATVSGRYTFTVPSVTATDVVRLGAFKAATTNLMNGYEGIDLTFIYSWT
jgi:hypothetical protein